MGAGKRFVASVVLGLSLFSSAAFSLRGPSAELATELTSECEDYYLFRELTVYRDPSFFLRALAEFWLDPITGARFLARERDAALLTTVRGAVHLQRVGPSRPFHTVAPVDDLYFRLEPRLRAAPGAAGGASVVDVLFCADREAYAGALGFVLEDSLRRARTPEGLGMPPSLKEIPPWPTPPPVDTARR